MAPRAANATQRGLRQCFGAAGGAGTELTLPAGAPPSSSQVATRSASGGSLLSPAGVNVLAFNPRGLQSSEGFATLPNTLADIGAALEA